jgi:hypothetical protein
MCAFDTGSDHFCSYSARKVMTGLAVAALIAEKEMVSRAISAANSAAVKVDVRGDAENTVRVIVVAIIAEFVRDEQGDQETNSKAHGQPENIDDGKGLAVPDIAESGCNYIHSPGDAYRGIFHTRPAN